MSNGEDEDGYITDSFYSVNTVMNQLLLNIIANTDFILYGAPAHNSLIAINYLNELFGNRWIFLFGNN